MKFLIIQTAFIGDVVLATAIVEKLKLHYPDSHIDFLVRKGNESLLTNHPHLSQVLVFDKGTGKFKNLFSLIRKIRKEKYDYVINAQRFLATGLITVLSGAKHAIGFDKNPLSFLFSKAVSHAISKSDTDNHEVKRNLALVERLTDTSFIRPVLYPSTADVKNVKQEKQYVCIAPASVWFTKQLPATKWIELINILPSTLSIILIGAKGDQPLCAEIKQQSDHQDIKILAGQLSFLESAALMKGAVMNYVNDSAPLHFASAVNAPVTAFYCSTVPAFGFGPLSDSSYVFETNEKLDCRPCGLHGYKACPKGHFKCAQIDMTQAAAMASM